MGCSKIRSRAGKRLTPARKKSIVARNRIACIRITRAPLGGDDNDSCDNNCASRQKQCSHLAAFVPCALRSPLPRLNGPIGESVY
jgi:hypothetical protein